MPRCQISFHLYHTFLLKIIQSFDLLSYVFYYISENNILITLIIYMNVLLKDFKYPDLVFSKIL